MGDVLSFQAFVTESLKKRIMSKVTKHPNGCWTWNAHTGTDHFGQIAVNGKAQPAHREVYKLYKGAIPAGKLLQHSCDNRKCVNPAHLKPGTKQSNNEDTARKGRSRNQHTAQRTVKGSPKDTGDRP